MGENYLIDSLQYKVQPVTAIDVAALWKERLLLFILLRLLSRPELILLGLLFWSIHPYYCQWGIIPSCRAYCW